MRGSMSRKKKVLIVWLLSWFAGVIVFIYVWEDSSWPVRIGFLIIISILAPAYRDILKMLKRDEM